MIFFFNLYIPLLIILSPNLLMIRIFRSKKLSISLLIILSPNLIMIRTSRLKWERREINKTKVEPKKKMVFILIFFGNK